MRFSSYMSYMLLTKHTSAHAHEREEAQQRARQQTTAYAYEMCKRKAFHDCVIPCFQACELT